MNNTVGFGRNLPHYAPKNKQALPFGGQATRALVRSAAVAGLLASGGQAALAQISAHPERHVIETALQNTTLGNGIQPVQFSPSAAAASTLPAIMDNALLSEPSRILELIAAKRVDRVSYSPENGIYSFSYLSPPTQNRRTVHLRESSILDRAAFHHALAQQNLTVSLQTARNTQPVSSQPQPSVVREDQTNGLFTFLFGLGIGGLVGGLFGTMFTISHMKSRQRAASEGPAPASSGSPPARGGRTQGKSELGKMKDVAVERPKVRLSDVKGQDDIMEEVSQIIQRIRAMNWDRTRRNLVDLVNEGRENIREEEREPRATLAEDIAWARETSSGNFRKMQTIERLIEKTLEGKTEAEIAELDRNFALIKAHRGKIPKGILLTGPPGTGKTLTARAIAGEADANFFRASASEFVEIYVGNGASKVRDLFQQAKDKAKASGKPSIIFIDEIDAVGGKRGRGPAGGNDEREQTLNQLLTEMDGFDKSDNIIVIFATNLADKLDDALIRPGRIDQKLRVNRPDKKGRLEILRLYASQKPMAPDVNLNASASLTRGMVGADLESLVTTSSNLAIHEKSMTITGAHLMEAFQRVRMGIPHKSMDIKPESRRQIAAHELGHGIMSIVMGIGIHVMSMVPRDTPDGKLALGFVIPDPERHDEYMMSQSQILSDMLMQAAGRAAERVIYGDRNASTGAYGDQMQMEQGYRQLRTTRLLSDGRRTDYSDMSRPLSERDEIILSNLIANAEKTAMEIIRLMPRDDFEKMIDDSLKAGTLIEDEANQFFFNHMQNYDWEKAGQLIDNFLTQPVRLPEEKTSTAQKPPASKHRGGFLKRP